MDEEGRGFEPRRRILYRLSFVVLKNRMEGSNGRIQWNLRSAVLQGTRGGLNQPSSRGIAIYHYHHLLNINVYQNK